MSHSLAVSFPSSIVNPSHAHQHDSQLLQLDISESDAIFVAALNSQTGAQWLRLSQHWRKPLLVQETEHGYRLHHLVPSASRGTPTSANDDERIQQQQLLPFEQWDGEQPVLWLVVPAFMLPLARALVSIHRLDPYLSRHYFRQLTPILSHLTGVDHEALLMQALGAESGLLTERQQAYRQFEKKLVRQYRGH
ncbi:hypothetical protein ACFOSS_02975 [Pseudaeromonas sharmana]|uniref:Uncharacterized protein n=1 Tax=Pseudaeromonas sharmana TaxID=328412 RepID=A0ABV8CK83_9GAMM